MEATCSERSACRKVVRAELQERYRTELERAGFFRRCLLKRRMNREADVIVHKRLGLPGGSAMF